MRLWREGRRNDQYIGFQSLLVLRNAMKVLFCLCTLLGLLLAPLPSQAAKSWKHTLLYNFRAQDQCADGSPPLSGLVRDAKGNLFGTTETGGEHGQGVVFELVRGKNWKYNVLRSFCFSCGDGNFPASSLITDVNGNLYGIGRRWSRLRHHL
jgi:hypothetical protein